MQGGMSIEGLVLSLRSQKMKNEVVPCTYFVTLCSKCVKTQFFSGLLKNAGAARKSFPRKGKHGEYKNAFEHFYIRFNKVPY